MRAEIDQAAAALPLFIQKMSPGGHTATAQHLTADIIDRAESARGAELMQMLRGRGKPGLMPDG